MTKIQNNSIFSMEEVKLPPQDRDNVKSGAYIK